MMSHVDMSKIWKTCGFLHVVAIQGGGKGAARATVVIVFNCVHPNLG